MLQSQVDTYDLNKKLIEVSQRVLPYQDFFISLIMCIFTDTTQPAVATTHAQEPGKYLTLQ